MTKRHLGWYHVRVDWDTTHRKFKFRKNAYKFFDMMCEKYPDDLVVMTLEQPLFMMGIRWQISKKK